MAPIKAVLRSKLDKADTAKSLMELVDRYEVYSDVSCAASSLDDQSSDSEIDASVPQDEASLPPPQDEVPLPALFPRPADGGDTATLALQLQYFSQLIYQQIQQSQPRRLSAYHQDDQPLNLSINTLKRPAPDGALQDDEVDVFEAKRLCLPAAVPQAALAAAPVAMAAPASSSQQRRRKRSYRLSDNDEIRAFQSSAPELFAWNGHKPMIHQFLLKLLNNPSCSGLIRWLDRDNRLFKVLQPGAVARLWQFIKGNRTDNYECFARGIRHSRDIGKFFEAHELRKKKVYKFAEKALRPADRQREEEHLQQRRRESPSPRHQQQQQLAIKPQQQQPAELSGSGQISGVLAKLKSALVERQQHQMMRLGNPQPLALPVKEELSEFDSRLVIAGCEHL